MILESRKPGLCGGVRSIAYPTLQGGVFDFESGSNIAIPSISRLIPNTNDDAITEYFSRLIGISPNSTLVEEEQFKDSYSATLAHTRFYLFQDQWLVANPIVLFHRQAEPYIAQAIKDTLPYFLGAVREDYLKITSDLTIARRKLKSIQREIKEYESIIKEKAHIGQSLVVEAQQVGLINPEFIPKNDEEILYSLEKILLWQPDNSPYVNSNNLIKIRRELEDLHREFEQKKNEIDAAELFVSESEDYTNEATEQLMRLESIELINCRDIDSNKCPLCFSDVNLRIPLVRTINRELKNINDNIINVRRENPVLRKHIQKLKEDLEEKRSQIEERERSIRAATKERAEANRLQDTNARIARVVGRVSLYLETVNFENNSDILYQRLADTKNLIAYYNEKLDKNKIENDIKLALNLLSKYMTTWAKRMQLEHSDYPYYFDLSKLTVVAKRPGRPISMGHGGMGGGENWLGCHIITHLALHKYFIEHKRPVPGFLFLDQPSQVYFPSEIYKNMQGRKEELSKQDDLNSVNRLFELLFEVCEELYPNLQIIITEHANLDTIKFQEALVEEPWSGEGERALIPEKWFI